MKEKPHIQITLTENEAVVLWDLLSRFSQSNNDEIAFEDQAEKSVLWDIECMLEQQIPTQMHIAWKESLKSARDAVRDK